MVEGDKAVLRFLDGTILKGYLEEFSEEASVITVRAVGAQNPVTVSTDSLKAIFLGLVGSAHPAGNCDSV